MIIRRNNDILTTQAQEAKTWVDRLKGLLGKREMNENEALILTPCKGIHTFFMKFPIDAVFIDKKYSIVWLTSLAPNRLSSFYFNAKSVIEFPAGCIQKWNLKIGEILNIERDSHV